MNGKPRATSDPSARTHDPASDPHSRVVSRTAANLADALSRFRLDGLAPKGGTRLMTRAVVEWAEGLGWLPVTEMPLACIEDTPDYPGRQGYVNVYVARPGYRTDLVIEIDRTNKGWSAAKLGHCVRAGMTAIWIRWSGPGPMSGIVPAGVEVIFVSANKAPEAKAAREVEDQRIVPPGHSLSGASRALLASLYPAGPPPEDPGWQDEATVWRYVGELRPRSALIVRCRFGGHGPRALTLARTAEVVADELSVPVVTRERIRQVQTQALRQLRAKSSARIRRAKRTGEPLVIAAGTSPAVDVPRVSLAPPPAPTSVVASVPAAPIPAAPMPVARSAPTTLTSPTAPVRGTTSRDRRTTRPAKAIDLEQLRPLVIDLARASRSQGIRASMVGHVLRGSDGPVTRALVKRLDLPHDGVMPDVPYRPLADAIRQVAVQPPLRLVEGTIKLTG